MDKERKKQLRSQYKRQEHLQARKTLGLHPDQLRDLLEFLASSLDDVGIPCDHSLARTRKWAEQARLEVDAVLRGVQAFGGYCDCEVLMNVTPDKFGYSES